MNKQDIRQIRAGIRQSVKHRTERLEKIPRDNWPQDPDPNRLEVWISRDFLVQIFDDAKSEARRITINRTTIDNQGRWRDGITWDELQRIKADVGFGDVWAVEVFPPQDKVVNVANMRHLWIVPKPQFAWS